MHACYFVSETGETFCAECQRAHYARGTAADSAHAVTPTQDDRCVECRRWILAGSREGL